MCLWLWLGRNLIRLWLSLYATEDVSKTVIKDTESWVHLLWLRKQDFAGEEPKLSKTADCFLRLKVFCSSCVCPTWSDSKQGLLPWRVSKACVWWVATPQWKYTPLHSAQFVQQILPKHNNLQVWQLPYSWILLLTFFSIFQILSPTWKEQYFKVPRKSKTMKRS